jgi:hypothetical protein
MALMRNIRLLAPVVVCLVAVPAVSASAAAGTHARPSVSSVGPGTVHVGDTLTIRGRNFVAGKGRTSVAFKREGGAAVSVKAAKATRTRLTVVVPAALARSLDVVAGVAQPTRFGVRVKGRRTSKWYMTAKRSAVVVPGTGAGAGAIDALGKPAHCVGAAPADTVDDVVYSLDDAVDSLLGNLANDPVEAAAEKTLCSGPGATVADDPAPPDATGPGIDPDDSGDDLQP